MVELLVTMVLLGLIAAVVAPGLDSWLSARNAAAMRTAISSEFALLPLRANRQGERIVIDSVEDLELVLDNSSSLKIDEPVIVLKNGFCKGGRFSLTQGNRYYAFDVLPPYCQVGQIEN